MKNILKFLSFSLILFVGLVSCDEDETTYKALKFPEDSFVSLEKASATIAESSDTLNVKINLSTDKANANIERIVSFSLSGSAVKGIDYTIVDDKTSFVFKPNSFQDIIRIVPIDNTVEDGDKDIIITLGEASGVNLGFPGTNNTSGKNMLIKLEDDDCAFVAEVFTGVPSGTETSSGSAGEKPSEAKFTLESSTATTATYKVENLLAPQFTKWGEKVTTGGEYYITLDNTDPKNPKITAIDNGDPLGNGLAFFHSQTDSEWGYYAKLEKATFSTCAKTIDLEFSVDITQASTGKVYPDDMKITSKLTF